MGKLIELASYRTRLRTDPKPEVNLRVEPPYLVIRHLLGGVVVREERVLSEFLVRSMLEHLP